MNSEVDEVINNGRVIHGERCPDERDKAWMDSNMQNQKGKPSKSWI